MKYKKITVKTVHEDSELIADAMFSAGAQGVDILDRHDLIDVLSSNLGWDYVDDSLLADDGKEVYVSTVVYTGPEAFIDALKDELSYLPLSVRYEIIAQDIESEDWENEWKKYYKPIKTKNITVVPGWIDYTPSDGEKIIRLDPGKAFGTGEHATTRMCLELMPDVKGKKVLDIGCGSGILGISAKLCGADDVYMCDLDPDSVEFSKQNADINGVELTVEKADLLEKTELKGDVIFANITADILIRLSEGIIKHLNDGATVILSGIIESREDDVKKAYEKLGLKLMDRMEEGDWRALKYLWR